MTIENTRRIELLHNLGLWLELNDVVWQQTIIRAIQANPWFTQDHVEHAVASIRTNFLDKQRLENWISNYSLASTAKQVGIVMAGNIPLVGFHDFICGFLSGHRLAIKLSGKDSILFPFLLRKLGEWEPEVLEQVKVQERLNGCDAYIATGSNNTARYFEEYFGKYPNIIRRNRTSVAILTGKEDRGTLELLADDVYMYFGLGCRNITQVCVPDAYDFEPLLRAFDKYAAYADKHKYKNNYDYHLALYLLNRVPYMSNSSILLVENQLPFSAVSVLHYRYYNDKSALIDELQKSNDIQAITGDGFIPFGKTQQPTLTDYADNADTMAFLCGL